MIFSKKNKILASLYLGFVLQVNTSFAQKGDQQVLDFESESVTGARRVPLGSLIDKGKVSVDYNFVKIRKNWHPEILDSTLVLDSMKKDKKNKKKNK